MPILQFHLSEGVYDDGAIAALLQEASLVYVKALYPGVEPAPIERVRAFVSFVPQKAWATGGVLVANGGTAAPYFTCLSLTGRPRDLLQALLSNLTDVVARQLGCPRSVIRGMVQEVPPELWSIAGVAASEVRKDEVAARKG